MTQQFVYPAIVQDRGTYQVMHVFVTLAITRLEGLTASPATQNAKTAPQRLSAPPAQPTSADIY
jgi:hypothetical protein